MNNDLISRSALKESIRKRLGISSLKYLTEQEKVIVDEIDNAPTVERRQGEWIPVKYRPLTVEQRIAFADHYGIEFCDTLNEKAFDCPMPEDGQAILVSTSWGVHADVAAVDIDGDGFICYGLDENGDWEGIDAWMPLPEPYKEETENE